MSGLTMYQREALVTCRRGTCSLADAALDDLISDPAARAAWCGSIVPNVEAAAWASQDEKMFVWLPPEVLARPSKSLVELAGRVVTADGTSAVVLRVLAENGNRTLRRLAAMGAAMSESVLAFLAEDTDWSVRRQAALHPRMPVKFYDILLDDFSDRVRSAATRALPGRMHEAFVSEGLGGLQIPPRVKAEFAVISGRFSAQEKNDFLVKVAMEIEERKGAASAL